MCSDGAVVYAEGLGMARSDRPARYSVEMMSTSAAASCGCTGRRLGFESRPIRSTNQSLLDDVMLVIHRARLRLVVADIRIGDRR